MTRRLLLCGFALWLAGTVILRLWGQHLLHPRSLSSMLLLYTLSVLAMAGLARRLCKSLGLARHEWPVGAVLLALPTLVLDPFSSAFFPVIFPNMPPSSAGLFGGWMLCCCAGALAGTTIGTKVGAAMATRPSGTSPDSAHEA